MPAILKSSDLKFLDQGSNGFGPVSRLTKYSEVNRKSLLQLVIFLTKLKKENLLDDKQFSELIILACTNYIGNEIEYKVSKTLNDILFFRKIIKL
ncbi:MAG: hypothetical protein WHT29_02235 [Bacteroidales bacterium]|nr:hypothetical protein [Bacteroidales bacterium]HOK98163.1 hypothetical protein [Bacteroidales bacterium]HPO65258.1 hypothetical protein [Bacteroidales bacterium]